MPSRRILITLVRLKVSRYCLAVCMIWLLPWGCVWNRTPALKTPDEGSKSTVDQAPERKNDSKKRERPERSNGTKPARASTSENSGAVGGKGRQEEVDLDRKLRRAAEELALELGQIKAMKLCYVEKANEWWVILYRDIGPVIDVRNFIWNWEEESFRPYLVVKRIPKNELQRKVKKHEWGRRCVILKPPGTKPGNPSKKPSRRRNESGVDS